MEKKSIRKRLLNGRNQLDPGTYSRLSCRAQRTLIDSDCFALAEKLALYSPIKNEVATGKIFVAAKEAGKKVYYPKIVADNLDFVEVGSLAELSPGAFGVPEPPAGLTAHVTELQLIVVPGLAFDQRGHRLGYGRGYYDRQLSVKPGTTTAVGLCFEFQICARLPEEGHDQQLDFIATESRLIPCHIGVAGS